MPVSIIAAVHKNWVLFKNAHHVCSASHLVDQWPMNRWCQPIFCWDMKHHQRNCESLQSDCPGVNHSVRAVRKKSCRCRAAVWAVIASWNLEMQPTLHFLLLGCWQQSIGVVIFWVWHRTNKSWFWCSHLFRMVAVGRIPLHILVVRQWRSTQQSPHCNPVHDIYIVTSFFQWKQSWRYWM